MASGRRGVGEFTALLGLVEGFAPGWLEEAVQYPALDSWVRTAERLLTSGAFTRYFSGHPARHLSQFGRLLLAGTAFAPSGAAGTLPMMGRRAFALAFGRTMIRRPGLSKGSRARWEVQGRLLRVQEDHAVLEVDLDSPASWSTNADWKLDAVPEVFGIAIDAWSPEYVGLDQLEAPRQWMDDAAHAMEAVLGQLDAAVASKVRSYVRCVAPASPRHPWIAGLARLGRAADLTPLMLTEALHRDRVGRLLQLSRFGGEDLAASFVSSSDLERSILDTAAAICGRWELGLPARWEDEARWEALVAQLGSPDLAADLLSGRTRPPERAAEPRPAVLSFESELERILPRDSWPAAVRRLRKTRRYRNDEVDWSTLDSLSRLDRGIIDAINREASSSAEDCEGCACLSGMTAYLLGDFATAVRSLALALKADGDVEQHWILMAFCLRHLGRARAFDALVFDGTRELRDLAQVTGICEIWPR